VLANPGHPPLENREQPFNRVGRHAAPAIPALAVVYRPMIDSGRCGWRAKKAKSPPAMQPAARWPCHEYEASAS
jgi:hypothetical protein